MKTAYKVFISLVLLVTVAFTCIGYASVTDSLEVKGVMVADPPPKVIDYIYISSATISGAKGQDSVRYTDGSSDYSNQFGYMLLTLDFTTENTKDVSFTLTNKASSRLAYYKCDFECIGGTSGVSEVIPSGLKALPNDDYPDLEGGFDETKNIVGVPDSELTSTNEYVIQQGASYNASATITSSVSDVAQVIVRFYYASPTEADQKKLEGDATVAAASSRLADVLNSRAGAAKNYNQLIQQMKDASYQDNYVGNVIGASDSDSEFIAAVFGDTLNSVSIGGGESTKCTVMIKKKNVTSKYSGDEFVLYMTTDDPSNPKNVTSESDSLFNGDYILVSALVFVKDTDGVWKEYGGIYTGEAAVNNYSGGLGGSKNSFNTEKWRAYGAQSFTTIEADGSNKQYTVSDNNNINACISAFENRK